MQTVGAVGFPARGIAARNSASYGCLQWCGQECPHLLRFAFSFNVFYIYSFLLLCVHLQHFVNVGAVVGEAWNLVLSSELAL